MALITHKPTSPGRRDAVSVRTEGLHKGAPYAPLTESQSKHGWSQPFWSHHHASSRRRSQAGITASSISSATRKASPPGRAHGVRSEPHRAYRAAVLRRWRAPLHHRAGWRAVGDRLVSGRDAPIKAGNSLPLRNIPVGTHDALHRDAARARVRRSRARAGASVQLMARETGYATLRLRSGEMRRVLGRLPRHHR